MTRPRRGNRHARHAVAGSSRRLVALGTSDQARLAQGMRRRTEAVIDVYRTRSCRPVSWSRRTVSSVSAASALLSSR